MKNNFIFFLFFFLILISLASAECDCVEINGTKYNSSQVDYIIRALSFRIEELEHPVTNSTCRFVLNSLNSKIRELNQIAEKSEKGIKYRNIFIALLSITVVAFYIIIKKKNRQTAYPKDA